MFGFWCLLALASWRAASMVVDEEGPYGIFERLRYFAGVRIVPVQMADGEWGTVHTAANTWSRGIMCVWCVSVWFALILLALCWLLPVVGAAVTLVLSISAGAIIVHEVVGWIRSHK